MEILKLPFQKISALRDICLGTGIVLEVKNYDIFENSSNATDKIPPFNIRNIVCLEAKSKHMELIPHNLYEK